MKNNLFLIASLALFANTFSQEITPADEAKAFLEEKRNDTEIYWGEGICQIGDDPGKAKINAKKRALADLTEKIGVRVETDLKTILSVSKNMIIKDEMVEQISTYTERAIADLAEKYFLDFPKKKSLTYFVYIEKAAYKKKVQEDLETKKAAVRQAVENGTRNQGEGRYLEALHSWLQAYSLYREFFGQLPMQDTIGNGAGKVEVTSFIAGKIQNIFNGITSSLFNSAEITYTSRGELSEKPVAVFNYLDNTGKKVPLLGLPVKGTFANGAGRCPTGLATGDYGQVTLPIENMDASFQTTVVLVGIDRDRLPGIDLLKNVHTPDLNITLKKTRTMAICLVFGLQGEERTPEALMAELSGIIGTRGFSPVSITSRKGNQAAVMQEAKKANADYVLWVKITANSAVPVGGFNNLYTADCSGTIRLFQFPTAQQTGSVALSPVKGYGSDMSGAAWDGLGKMKKDLKDNITLLLDKIK